MPVVDGDGYSLEYAVNGKGGGYVLSRIENINVGREGLEIRIVRPDDGAVVGIADDAFKNCDAIKSVVIPCTVETIDIGSFRGCGNLEEVVFEGGSSLKSIGRFAFYGCKKLKAIAFPDGVTHIDESAFESCEMLSELSWGECASIESIGRFAFRGCSALKNVAIPKSSAGLEICEGAFAGCGIESVTFSEGENQIVIGKSAFRGCAGVTEIAFSKNVVHIGMSAFRDCESLEKITWTEGQSILKTIGVSAFSGCRRLRHVTVPVSEDEIRIGRAAFDGCFRLIEVVNLSGLRIRSGSATHGGIALHAKKVNKEKSENGEIVKSDDGLWLCFIVERDFGGNGCILTEYLGDETSLTLPDHVVCHEVRYECDMMGGGVFYGCGSLESVTVPKIFKEVGDYAFYKSKITQVTLPEGLTKIGGHAFAESALESVTIPGTVTEIGASAFERCTSLKRVDAKNLTSWLSIKFGNEYSNPLFCGKAGLYWLDDGDVPVTGIEINGRDGQALEIPQFAFAGAPFSSVNLCGVARIGRYAFYGSGVGDVAFSDILESIDDFAFYGCFSLKNVRGLPRSASIGHYAFYGCPCLESGDDYPFCVSGTSGNELPGDPRDDKWDRVDIRAEVGKFMAVYVKDPCSRYRTYDYTHGVFLKHMEKGGHDMSELSRALFTFLASWGMLRGSSFLLYKSPGFLSGICEIVCDEKYRWLMDVNPFPENKEFDDGLYVSAVCELKERIAGYFVGKGYYKGGDAFEEPIDNVTDKQVSKILLVTLGCVPAYDTFVTEALKDLEIGQTINDVGLRDLLAFTRCHEEAIEKAIAEYGNVVGTTYSVMKYVDMALWGYGYPLARKNGKADDEDAV